MENQKKYKIFQSIYKFYVSNVRIALLERLNYFLRNEKYRNANVNICR